MAQHNELGKQGEKIAQDFLLKNGYQILETNWRFQKAEVDIIALKDEVLVAIEVKTRTSEHYGKPEIFVNQKKIRLLVGAIDHYVQENDMDVEVRFDIISIIKNQYAEKIEHLENAFIWF